jgi:isocitrate lyase
MEHDMSNTLPTAEQITQDWKTNSRWAGIERNYSAEDVVRLRGTIGVEHTLAKRGAERLWTRCTRKISSTRWAR